MSRICVSFWFPSCKEQSKGRVEPFLSHEEQSKGRVKRFLFMRDSPKEELNLSCWWGTVQRRSWTFLACERHSKGGVEPIFLVYGQSIGRPLVWVQSEGGAEPLRQTMYPLNLGQLLGMGWYLDSTVCWYSSHSCSQLCSWLQGLAPLLWNDARLWVHTWDLKTAYCPTLTLFSCRYSSLPGQPQLLLTSRSASHRSAARFRAPELPAKRKTRNMVDKDCLGNCKCRVPGIQDN